MRKTYVIAVVGLSMLGLSGCSSGGSGSSASSAMTISGTLGTGTVSLTGKVTPKSPEQMQTESEGTFAISNYGVRCVTLAATPTAAEGQCDSSGKFNIALAGATNVPIGCFVIAGTGSSASVVATLAFQAATTDINGNASRAGSYVAGSNTAGVTLGAVTLDLSKGLAVVPTAQIATTGTTGSGTANGTFADMTGNWTIRKLNSVPVGFVTAGTSGGNDGPQDGQVVYVGYYTAAEGALTHHGLSIWNSLANLTSCSGEGITLPGGWALSPNSSPNTYLNTTVSVTTSIPAPASVKVSCSNGQNFADLATSVCASANAGNSWQSTNTCGDILTNTAFSNGTAWAATTSCSEANASCASNTTHWGLTPIKAAFLCTMNGIRQAAGGCGGDVNIDWGNFWSAGNTTAINNITYGSGVFGSLPAADTTHSDSVTYFNGAVRFQKTPSNRFMMGEFFQNGNTGSLTDHHDYTANACLVAYGSGGTCSSQTTCHIAENNKLTITQTDSTHANVELDQIKTVSPTDDPACTTDTYISGKLQQVKFMFMLAK